MNRAAHTRRQAHAYGVDPVGCRVGTQVGIDLRFRCGIADRIEVWLGCRILLRVLEFMFSGGTEKC